MTDYNKIATEFLEKHGIVFSAVLIGNDCPMFCEDAQKGKDMDKVNVFPRKSHIHGKHYRCTLVRPGKPDARFDMDYWNSYSDEEFNAKGTRAFQLGESYMRYGTERKPRTPKPYDVLAILQKNDPGSFDDFCSEFGYDTDSRRAETTWRAVVEEWRKVSRFFSADEIAELQEIN